MNPEILVEEVPCDLCGSNETAEVLRVTDRNWALLSGDFGYRCPHEWVLVKCRVCGLTYLNPRPVPSSICLFYPSEYYAHAPSNGAPFSSWPQRIKRFIKRLLRRRALAYRLTTAVLKVDGLVDPIVETIGFVKPGRVLDVGCGAGALLDGLRELGWETFGVEISTQAAEVARSKGHTVWTGDASEADLPQNFFDVAVLSHVLEHVPSPTKTLSRLHAALRPAGQVIVDVPNWGSPWCKVFSLNNWNLDLPRHFYHFESNTLARLAESAGFTISRIVTRATPRFLLWSLALMVLGGQAELCPDAERLAVVDLLHKHVDNQGFSGFCKTLEAHGWGNHLRLIGVRGG